MTKKKKVLFLIPTLGGGGAEKVLVNVVNALSQDKYDITVMCIFNYGVNKRDLNENIHYKYIFRRVFKGNTYVLKYISAKILYKLFIREHYDILVAFLQELPTKIISGCNSPNSKLYCWIHNDVENIKFQSFVNRNSVLATYKRYDRIIAVSEYIKKSFQRFISKDLDINVIYNPLNINSIITLSSEKPEIIFNKDKINIITIGRLHPQKNYLMLLRVIKRLSLSCKDFHLYIVGEGEERNKLESYIISENIQNVVSLLGFHKNPYKFLVNADLFVCSSLHEGYSTVVSESLILGVPVITTKCSGMTEQLGENNEYGIIVENNEEALYNGMLDLLSNEEKIKYYKEKAKERGLMFYDKCSVKDIEKMFDKN